MHSLRPDQSKLILKSLATEAPLIAKDIDGLLLAGRCISGDFLSHSSYRVTGNAVAMGEAAGVPGDKSGTQVIGARGNPTPTVNVGGIALYTEGIFTTLYSEISFEKPLRGDWAIQLAAQGARQFSNGEERLGDFDTNFAGGRLALSHKGTVLTLARTGTGRGASIRKPFGGTPSFTSSMIFDYDRAGEQARRIGL